MQGNTHTHMCTHACVRGFQSGSCFVTVNPNRFGPNFKDLVFQPTSSKPIFTHTHKKPFNSCLVVPVLYFWLLTSPFYLNSLLFCQMVWGGFVTWSYFLNFHIFLSLNGCLTSHVSSVPFPFHVCWIKSQDFKWNRELQVCSWSGAAMWQTHLELWTFVSLYKRASVCPCLPACECIYQRVSVMVREDNAEHRVMFWHSYITLTESQRTAVILRVECEWNCVRLSAG